MPKATCPEIQEIADRKARALETRFERHRCAARQAQRSRLLGFVRHRFPQRPLLVEFLPASSLMTIDGAAIFHHSNHIIHAELDADCDHGFVGREYSRLRTSVS